MRKDVAAARLLDREPPAGYLEEWTERIAAEAKITLPGIRSVVIFRIGVEWLALPTRVFQEVVQQCAVHTLPHRRNGILAGLASIRGELLICVSLGAALGLENAAETGREPSRTTYERLLVVDRAGERLTFPVDEVHGVHRYHPSELKDTPATLASVAATHTIGMLPWENRTVGCLDDELLFHTLNKSLS